MMSRLNSSLPISSEARICTLGSHPCGRSWRTSRARNANVLHGRAIALGWRDDQITDVDNDQGESGGSAAWREGFSAPGHPCRHGTRLNMLP